MGSDDGTPGNPPSAGLEALQAFIAASPEPMAITRDGQVVLANRALADLFGYDDEGSLRGRSIVDLAAPEGYTLVMELWRRRGAGEEVPPVFSTRAVRRDGTTFTVRIRTATLLVDGKRGALLLVEEAAAERERDANQPDERGVDFYRAVFDVNTAVKLLIAPTTGRIVDANVAAAQFYGWPLDVLRTMRITDINTLTPAEVKAEMENARTGRRRYFRFRHRTAGGEVRHVEIHSGPVNIGGEVLLLSIVHDVTERDALEEQLRQSQRLEIVGRLAGGVAHDFNNLLTVMLTATELVRRGLPEASVLHQHLSDLDYAGRRAADLTRELLAFSRRQRIKPALVDLGRVVEQMHGLLQRTLGPAISVETALARSLPLTLADPGQFEHVIMNLALNARDAMPRGGKLVLGTRTAHTYDDDARGIPVGDWVVLRVTDEGRGMDEETRARAFEPFFTTKEPGKGTGLGLSTVYGIVTQSGGHITIKSAPDHGTEFELYLPVTHATRSAMPEPRARVGSTRHGRLLLVDDVDNVRASLALALADAGFEVVQARSADEALVLPDAALSAVDALVTDVVMPGRSGVELAAALLARRADLPILLISGDLRGTDLDRLPAHVHFMHKPFTGPDLADAVAAMLDERNR